MCVCMCIDKRTLLITTSKLTFFYSCALVLTDTYFPSTLYLQDLQPTWPEHHPLSWPGYLHLKKRP